METPRKFDIIRDDDKKLQKRVLSERALAAIHFKNTLAEGLDLSTQQEAALLYAKGYFTGDGTSIPEDRGDRLSAKQIAQRLLPSHIYGNTVEEHRNAADAIRFMVQAVMPEALYKTLAARHRGQTIHQEVEPEILSQMYRDFYHETVQDLLGIDLDATRQFFDRSSTEVFRDVVTWGRDRPEIRRIVVGSADTYEITDAQAYYEGNTPGHYSRLTTRQLTPGFLIKYRETPILITGNREFIAIRGVKKEGVRRRVTNPSHVVTEWNLGNKQRLVVHDKAVHGNDYPHLIRRKARPVRPERE